MAGERAVISRPQHDLGQATQVLPHAVVTTAALHSPKKTALIITVAGGEHFLALLRYAILAIIPPDEHASLNQASLYYADHRSVALRLITQAKTCAP